MDFSKINVTKLVSECKKRVEVLPDDGKDYNYPSTKGLLMFAALILEDVLIGDKTEDVFYVLGDAKKHDE